MKIKSIHGLASYLVNNSGFSKSVVNGVINSLGYNPHKGSADDFKELSCNLQDCSRHGADGGFSGFIYHSDTVPFFKKHRSDIIAHMEQTAEGMGTDIISMVQGFGVFRYSDKPTPSEVGRALWDKSRTWPELTDLYNVFAWYALEEIAHTWYRYLEENPAHRAELSA
jgi:hypothetical protein